MGKGSSYQGQGEVGKGSSLNTRASRLARARWVNGLVKGL